MKPMRILYRISKFLKLTDQPYDVWYCISTHTAYSHDVNNWICEKCGTVYPKKLSDNDTGPK